MKILVAFAAEQRGAVTAEFAIVLPAILVVLALIVGALNVSAGRVALTGLAGDLARLEARGDRAAAGERLSRFEGSPSVSRATEDGVLCVTARSGSFPFAVSATGCAAITGPAAGDAGGDRAHEGRSDVHEDR